MSTNLTIGLGQLKANPYRDLNLFPINGIVVDSLKESIKDTDFWDNLVVRLENNTLCDGTPIASAAELTALFNSDHDFAREVFELCYGHHRLAALEDLGWDDVDLPVKWVSDENMLKMMANENKDSSMNQIAVKLETVRQVKASLEETLAGYKNFSAYKKDKGALYSNKQGFENARENGVGFKAVKKFLGETWSETDIRYSFAVLSHIANGCFLQEDVIDVPSIGLLESIGGIADFILHGNAKKEMVAPDWPQFFKDDAIAEIVDRCKVDAKGWQKVTVSQLRKAKSLLVNEGINPASFLKSGNVKTAFDIVKATKGMVYIDDKDLEFNLAAIEELRDKEGFSDYHDLEELLKRVIESVTKSLDRKAAGKDDEDELEPVDGSELEKTIADADDEIAVPNMFEMGEMDDDTVVPVGHIVSTYVQTVQHLVAGVAELGERLEEVGEDTVFDAASINALAAIAQLTLARSGKETLIEVFNSVTNG